MKSPPGAFPAGSEKQNIRTACPRPLARHSTRRDLTPLRSEACRWKDGHTLSKTWPPCRPLRPRSFHHRRHLPQQFRSFVGIPSPLYSPAAWRIRKFVRETSYRLRQFRSSGPRPEGRAPGPLQSTPCHTSVFPVDTLRSRDRPPTPTFANPGLIATCQLTVGS